MLFADLVKYFVRIEATSLRNAKTEILAEILKEASPEESDKLVYLSLGELRPQYDRLEFNLAEKMIVRAMALATGKTVAEVTKEYKQVGDLGEVAGKYQVSSIKYHVGETVTQVYEELTKIARDSGAGSQERKVANLARLIKGMEAGSAKYVVRMVMGKLRLGFSDKTVLDALSYTAKGTKEYSGLLDRAYQVRPDVGALAKMVKEMGVEKAVEKADVTLGTPIVPALAQRLKTAKEMIEKMGRVIVEPKFDGTRVQIHFNRNESENLKSEIPNSKQIQNSNIQTGLFGEEKPQFWVKSFTRNLDNNTAQFPELMRIGEQIKAHEIILDCEAVGYEPKTGKLVPFQLTITRKRKHGVGEAQSAVPLRFFVFDLMYRDGQSLIHLPLSERKQILRETINPGEVLVVDEFIETDNPDELREYHKKQLAEGLEGALVKQMSGEYMPGRTGWNWVKFKEAEDSRAKLSDTIDGVVMGYYRGKGKRTGFGLGAFLIGVSDGEKIVTLAKIGTGISDEQFGELYERLKKIEQKDKNSEYQVDKLLTPDMWVEPRIVVEVAADEITKSPIHSAGYALRFPRLVKFRDDKDVVQITTLTEVKEMYDMANS